MNNHTDKMPCNSYIWWSMKFTWYLSTGLFGEVPLREEQPLKVDTGKSKKYSGINRYRQELS
jgi:hypothetical protein